jgi:hypothetical protein
MLEILNSGFDPANGLADEIGGGFRVEFSLNAFAIGFDGLDAQAQEAGDFACAFALADELKNLEFAIAQGTDRRC